MSNNMDNMGNVIKILHLEDNPIDSQLVQSVLNSPNVKMEYFFADNERDYLSILENHNIDLILSDYHLPDYSGSEALIVAKNKYPHIPFVFLSGTMGEDAAIESLLNGATDYVLKNKMERLVPAVNRAFNEAQAKKARQTAENELRKLSRAVEQSPNIIIITDTEGKIEYANPTTSKITGYSNEEIVGNKPWIFNSGNKPKEDYEEIWRIIRSGKEWQGELRSKKKNGELYWEAAKIFPIFDDKCVITHFVAIKEDVTESKNLTLELIKAKEKAEESDRLKTAFLHNISHEIRTPMNAIVGFSDFLNSPGLNSKNRQRYTDIIVKSSDQLLSIISDIVNIATIEAGQERVHENEINLYNLLKLIADQFKVKAANQKIDLNLNFFLTENEDTIISDEAKLNQILYNLVGNAIKFTKQGSVNIGCALKDNEIVFSVADTGIGIPTEMHDEIFKRFRQVENTTSEFFGGSGLGLSISKAYVEILGGKMWLVSQLNKGSTFYFTIPYIKTEKERSFERLSSREILNREHKSKTVLIAEDEDSNFLLLEMMMEGLNVNIIRATTGKEAVEICKANPVDLILMDIKMPVMDGYDATKLIRVFLPDLPIIFQTAYATEEDMDRAYASGCTDFLSKPISKEHLISKITDQLNKL